MRARALARLAAAFSAAWLAGCAALAPPPPVSLEGLPTTFEMAGRLSVAQDGAGEIVRIRWAHRGERDEIALSTPVGGDLALIEGGSAGYLLHRPGQVPIEYGTFSDLTSHLLSASIDRSQFIAWLHGRVPTGGAAQGWAVEVPETQEASGATVARRVIATRGDTVVKLVVDRYRTPAE
jgi:outer membrane biogenesis lipoprotein LolB